MTSKYRAKQGAFKSNTGHQDTEPTNTVVGYQCQRPSCLEIVWSDEQVCSTCGYEQE